jgi:hypothetical protein
MPKSVLFHTQLLTFCAGFFLSTAVSQFVWHSASTLWIDLAALSVVFLLWSRRQAGKLHKFAQKPKP